MSELVFGPLEGVAGDPSVTDVVVTGEGRIWVDRGGGMREYQLPIPFRSARMVRDYAVQLCAQLGRRRLCGRWRLPDCSPRRGFPCCARWSGAGPPY